MTGRSVHHGVGMLAAVALLLAMMPSPLPSTRALHRAFFPKYLPRNSAILNVGQIGQFPISARSCLREGGAFQSDIGDELDADIDDELTATYPPASAPFDVLPSRCPEPYSKLVSFALPFAALPLRC